MIPSVLKICSDFRSSVVYPSLKAAFIIIGQKLWNLVKLPVPRGPHKQKDSSIYCLKEEYFINCLSVALAI